MTAESIHRHSAYDSMNSAYNALPESEPFLITFTIPEHKVTITNNCMMFDWSFAKVKKNGVVGYCSQPSHNISILGKKVNGKIYPHMAMGHEEQHNWSELANGLIINPDKMDK
jgi:hypothetical protein